MPYALTRYEQAQGKSDAHFSDKAPEKFDLPLDDSQLAVIDYQLPELKQDGKLVGSYPITPGSKSLPAPIRRMVRQRLQLDADFPLG